MATEAGKDPENGRESLQKIRMPKKPVPNLSRIFPIWLGKIRSSKKTSNNKEKGEFFHNYMNTPV